MPLSSPTPQSRSTFNTVPASLIPFSPRVPLPNQPRRKRKQLQRGSSSEGVVLTGLSGWQRGPKPPSTKQSASQSKTQSKSRSKSKTRSDDENDVFRIDVGVAAKSKSNSGGWSSGKRQGSGLGMGMKGTPAKKRKTTSVASIGAMSTPKASTRPSLSQSQLLSQSADSESDSDISEAPPSEPPLSSADETLTSPSLSVRAALPIPRSGPDVTYITPRPVGPSGSGSESRLNRTVAGAGVDERSTGPAPLCTQYSRTEVREFLIPLNDLSSIASSTSKPSHPSRRGEPTQHDDSRNFDDSSAPQTTRGLQQDLTVPLNDLTRSTIGGDVTPGGTTSRPTSKLAGRQATPYRLVSDADFRTPRAGEDRTASEEGEDGSLEMGRQGQLSPAEPAEMHDFVQLITRESPESPSPRKSTEVFEHFDADTDPPWDQNDYMPGADQNPSASSVTTGSETSTSPSASARSWRDPFGFIVMRRVLQGRAVHEWYPSSQEGSPSPPRSPSPISFASTTTSGRRSTSEASSLSAASEIAAPVSSKATRSAKGKWRGAKVLARMEGADQRLWEESEDEQQRKLEGGAGAKGRNTKTVPVTEMSQDAIQARHARIEHYKALKTYNLRVEYVWC